MHLPESPVPSLVLWLLLHQLLTLELDSTKEIAKSLIEILFLLAQLEPQEEVARVF